MRKKIVILGSGFAGIYAYLELHKLFHGRKDISIRIINREESFVFTPLIHEVATGSLSPGSVTQPITEIPHCCLDAFIEGEVQSVDLDQKHITYTYTHAKGEEGEHSTKEEQKIKFDYLISALGSRTNYFGIVGAEANTLPLKTLRDAARIKNRILFSFEKASTIQDKEKRKSILRFVIVGGGPTGTELAGEISDLILYELRNIYPDIWADASVIIIEAKSRLLSEAGKWFSKKAQRILKEKLNVRVYLDSMVSKIEENGLYLGEKFISSETIIWVAGVRAVPLTFHGSNKLQIDEKKKRIHVNSFLQTTKYLNVFVVGDQAWICDKEMGQPYPMRAQFAVREGVIAARNIKHLIDNDEVLEEFEWKDKGFIVSLGKGGALAEVFGIRFSGFFAWWIYRLAYLSKLLGTRAKWNTAFSWILNFFLPRDLREL